MKVQDKEEDGVFLLLPENDWEGINNLIAVATVGIGGKLRYAGRDNERGGRYFSIRFSVEEREFLIVKGGTEEDKLAIVKIRGLCFNGLSNKMIVHGQLATNEGTGILITANYCRDCGRPMTERAGWGICRNCAETNCAHTIYERRLFTCDNEIAFCRVCTECGLPDPVDLMRIKGLPPEEKLAEIRRADPNLMLTGSLDSPRKILLAVRTIIDNRN